MIIEEKWIEVYPKYYLSNYGRWYSTKTNKFLKSYLNSSGYERVQIYINHNRKFVFTHIKVVEFFGDKNGKNFPKRCKHLRAWGISIDHLDRNKHNNSYINLEIVTHQENCLRRSRKENR